MVVGFTFILLLTNITPDSVSHAKMVSMFEAALKRHPEKTLRNPAQTFFIYFETPTPFYEVLAEKYLYQKGYEYNNIFELKRKDELAWILAFTLNPTSEVIIGEILKHYKDSVFNEYYTRRCPYGNVYVIRVDTVFMGNIDKGKEITVRKRVVSGPHANLYNLPYMQGDTVLVFLHHFPNITCKSLFVEHRNDIGYRTPVFMGGMMFLVTSLYFTKDNIGGKVQSSKGPLHVTFYTKPELWDKPFDYPYSEVVGKLGKFSKWIKEWQKEWYNLITPDFMDSLILNPSIQPGKSKIVQKTVRKIIEK
ncbi:hypothetical protein KAW48_11445 [candidate division WOR-3 bacterium]|nr:hypothetical protein [candidate division WOR-3 bacterium]